MWNQSDHERHIDHIHCICNTPFKPPLQASPPPLPAHVSTRWEAPSQSHLLDIYHSCPQPSSFTSGPGESKNSNTVTIFRAQLHYLRSRVDLYLFSVTSSAIATTSCLSTQYGALLTLSWTCDRLHDFIVYTLVMWLSHASHMTIYISHPSHVTIMWPSPFCLQWVAIGVNVSGFGIGGLWAVIFHIGLAGNVGPL